MRNLHRLLRDRRGSAVIELALVAPILAVLVIGVADISTAYGRKLEIEQAAQRAIERVMQTTGDTTVAATIQQEAVCQINGVKTDGTCEAGRITTANVAVRYRLECSAGGVVVNSFEEDDATTFDDLECTGTQSEARYIEVDVTDTYEPMFPLHFGTNSEGHYALSTTAGVRVQ